MEPTGFLAYLKLPTKIIASVGLLASAILFLPVTWVAALGLAEIRTQYKALLGCAVLLAAAVLAVEGLVYLTNWLRNRERQMPYERYTTDEFFGLRWRWRWYGGDVIGVKAFCSACDLQLQGYSPETGIIGMPTNELIYRCPCGATNLTLQASDPLQVAHVASLHAERVARSRGLLGS